MTQYFKKYLWFSNIQVFGFYRFTLTNRDSRECLLKFNTGCSDSSHSTLAHRSLQWRLQHRLLKFNTGCSDSTPALHSRQWRIQHRLLKFNIGCSDSHHSLQWRIQHRLLKFNTGSSFTTMAGSAPAAEIQHQLIIHYNGGFNTGC